MININRLGSLLCIIFSCFSSTVLALDFTTLHRATVMQDTPIKGDDANWQTSLYVTGLGGSTWHSFNSDGHKRALYDAHGYADLTRLGTNVENKTETTTPTLIKYWSVEDNGNGIFDTANLENLSGNDGKYSFGGKFETIECNIRLRQNIAYGFYVHAFLPLKELKLTNISGENKGKTTIKAKNDVNMNDFYKKDLPNILKEVGLGSLTDSYKTSGIGDATIGAGWQGFTDKLPKGMITSIAGFLEIGGAAPTANERDPNRVFDIARGFNHEWMAYFRANLQAGFWNVFNIGLEVGSTMIIRDTKYIRLQTDTNQNGWIKLQYGKALVDPGSLWDIGCYIQAGEKLMHGFSIIVGYTYTMQETTQLGLRDNSVLSTYDERMKNEKPYPTFISKDYIINGDKNLLRWDAHQLHLVAQCDVGVLTKSWVKPLIRLEYNIPLVGKYAWATEIFAGTAGVRMDWKF